MRTAIGQGWGGLVPPAQKLFIYDPLLSFWWWIVRNIAFVIAKLMFMIFASGQVGGWRSRLSMEVQSKLRNWMEEKGRGLDEQLGWRW